MTGKWAKTAAVGLALATGAAFSGGCESKAGTGAIVGGAGGAGLGAIIGHQSGHGGEGALIGGAVGAIGGGLVGHGMDESDKRKAAEQQRYDSYQDREYASRGGASSSESRYSGARVTKEEVVAWHKRGVDDAVIIDRIERSGTVFRLTESDEDYLVDQGLSDDVIDAMLATAK